MITMEEEVSTLKHSLNAAEDRLSAQADEYQRQLNSLKGMSNWLIFLLENVAMKLVIYS